MLHGLLLPFITVPVLGAAGNRILWFKNWRPECQQEPTKQECLPSNRLHRCREGSGANGSGVPMGVLWGFFPPLNNSSSEGYAEDRCAVVGASLRNDPFPKGFLEKQLWLLWEYVTCEILTRKLNAIERHNCMVVYINKYINKE